MKRILKLNSLEDTETPRRTTKNRIIQSLMVKSDEIIEIEILGHKRYEKKNNNNNIKRDWISLLLKLYIYISMYLLCIYIKKL